MRDQYRGNGLNEGPQDSEAAENKRKPIGSAAPSRILRETVVTEALRMYGDRPTHTIPRAIARNLRISAKLVDSALIVSLLQFRSERATLEQTLRNALDMARHAGTAVLGECA
jgi:hypothetical protein